MITSVKIRNQNTIIKLLAGNYQRFILGIILPILLPVTIFIILRVWSNCFSRRFLRGEGRPLPAKYLVKRNDAASQEVTHSAVAVYALIIAEEAEKGNRQI